MMEGIRLEFEGLGKRFDDRVIFRNVSGSVSQGEILVLSGPNGSGKSTLVSILCGLLRATRGKLRHFRDGEEIQRSFWRHHLGIVAPAMSLYEELTGMENLRFFARVRDLRLSDEDLALRLQGVGLDPGRKTVVRGYSTGMQQRLKIAQGALHDPPLLFLDEPGSNLDPAGQDWLESWVEELKNRGRAIVLASNDRRELGWGTQHVVLDS